MESSKTQEEEKKIVNQEEEESKILTSDEGKDPFQFVAHELRIKITQEVRDELKKEIDAE